MNQSKQEKSLKTITSIIAIDNIEWEKILKIWEKITESIQEIMTIINFQDKFTMKTHNPFEQCFFTTKTDTIDIIISLDLEAKQLEEAKAILLAFWREFESIYAKNFAFKTKSTNEFQINQYWFSFSFLTKKGKRLIWKENNLIIEKDSFTLLQSKEKIEKFSPILKTKEINNVNFFLQLFRFFLAKDLKNYYLLEMENLLVNTLLKEENYSIEELYKSFKNFFLVLSQNKELKFFYKEENNWKTIAFRMKRIYNRLPESIEELEDEKILKYL